MANIKFANIKTKEASDLKQELAETREELREVRFKVKRGEEKMVHRVKELKKNIARLLTALGLRE
ncbi:MAG TPA: 50S ribosomal protein L29 [Ignavibacteriales bacterium]|nr:50S ribosomal protein L29 [Ignavibacteriales bacterium]